MWQQLAVILYTDIFVELELDVENQRVIMKLFGVSCTSVYISHFHIPRRMHVYCRYQTLYGIL